ncbi:MAG: FkbM family methyltransferase [Caulobacteraceae bacterium]
MLDFPPAPEGEIYRGYDAEDLERVPRFRALNAEPAPGFLVDYFGVKIRSSLLGGGGSGQVQRQPPFPGDGMLSGGVEYASACIALEQSTGPTFTHVELGAGWGPWTALLGVLAARRGFSTVNALAVEAAPARFALLQAHLADNGMLPSETATEGQVGPFRTRAVKAAAWWKTTTLYFPDDNGATEDAGKAAVSHRSKTDYRGVAVRHLPTPAISIEKLCQPYDVVDFMHIDIQGGEWELIRRSKRFFDSKVRFLFVGTHDRKIEGDLIELLLNKGWKLFREKPCRFYGLADAPSLTGLTYDDGAQLWRNMTLG